MSQRGLGRTYRRGAGGWYWLEIWHDGRQHRKPAKTTDENEARTMLGQWLGEIASGSYAPEARLVAFADLEKLALENYASEGRRSVATLTNCIRHLREMFGSTRAVEITTPRLAAYVARRRKEKAAASTIHKELACMSLMLRLARLTYGETFRHRPEFPRVKIPKTSRRRGFFEANELAAVLAHLEPVYRPVIEFLSLTGWRLGEALALEWRQVDRKAGIIRIEDTKSDEPRTLPYTADPALADLIHRQREATARVERELGRIGKHVFHNEQGRPFTHGFHDAWEKARKAANLPGVLIHDLRRTAARDLVRAGVPEKVIMRLCGWETRSVFDRYAIVSESDLAEGLTRLAASRESRVRDVCGNSGDSGESKRQAVRLSR